MLRFVLSIAFLLALQSSVTVAQEAPPVHRQPIIATSATGEVRLAPEHAILQVNVEVSESKAVDAADRMKRDLQAVLDTLQGLGFPRDSLPTTSYGIRQAWDSQRNQPRGYAVSSTVRITIHDLDRLGTIIDAVIASGASRTSSIEYAVASPREGRDEALRLAVASARRDAEVLAAASGGRLGALLELRTEEAQTRSSPVRLEAVMVTATREPPTITPQEVIIRASVSATWQLLLNPSS